MNKNSPIKRWLALLAVIALLCGGALAEEPPILEAAKPYLAKNPATVGWLKVGDIVDMPVVRGDGEFYLHHDFGGVESPGGTIFLEEANSILPKDEHMIIYGHNMRDGSRFGSLDRYWNLSYLKKYPVITFETIYEECKSVVVAVYEMSGETEDWHFMQLLKYSFDDNEDFWTFFHQTERKDRNIYNIPVDVDYGDKLLTLITCRYTLFDGRLVVMCRELRPDETVEEVTALMQSATRK